MSRYCSPSFSSFAGFRGQVIFFQRLRARATQIRASSGPLTPATLETKAAKGRSIGEPLSEREIDVLNWIATGKSDWQIGRILEVSPKTVNYHVENAKRKLGAGTRIQAVVVAVRLRLVEGRAKE